MTFVYLFLYVCYLTGVTLLEIEATSLLEQLERLVTSRDVTVYSYEVGELCGYGFVIVLALDIFFGEEYRS